MLKDQGFFDSISVLVRNTGRANRVNLRIVVEDSAAQNHMETRSVLLVGENHWLLRAIRLMLDGAPRIVVTDACPNADVVTMAQRLCPDVIVFLPEVSLANCRETIQSLQAVLPSLDYVAIVADHALLYASQSASANRCVFISQAQLSSDLIPALLISRRPPPQSSPEES